MYVFIYLKDGHFFHDNKIVFGSFAMFLGPLHFYNINNNNNKWPIIKIIFQVYPPPPFFPFSKYFKWYNFKGLNDIQFIGFNFFPFCLSSYYPFN